MTDPIVDEVRQFRQIHAQRFHGDLEAICQDLRKLQQECGHPIATFQPQYLHPRKTLQAEPENAKQAAA